MGARNNVKHAIYVKPESEHLLAPEDEDLDMAGFWLEKAIWKRYGRYPLVEERAPIEPHPPIDRRRGIVFHWPESEEV